MEVYLPWHTSRSLRLAPKAVARRQHLGMPQIGVERLGAARSTKPTMTLFDLTFAPIAPSQLDHHSARYSGGDQAA